MPNSPGHRYGACQQCTGFGGEHHALIGAVFCKRPADSGMSVCHRPGRGCSAWTAAARKVIAPAPVDRRWPARDYAFLDPDRANWSRR